MDDHHIMDDQHLLSAPARWLGFFPRRRVARPAWLTNPAVTHIDSASRCIAPPPEGWLDHWIHNDLLLHDTEALALAVVPPHEVPHVTLFALRAWPWTFREGGVIAPWHPPEAPAPSLPGFRRLGLDVVSRSASAFGDSTTFLSGFECSPLSCNNLAAEVPVNAHCLLDAEAEALALARRCADEGPEPGPYHVVEVWAALEGDGGDGG